LQGVMRGKDHLRAPVRVRLRKGCDNSQKEMQGRGHLRHHHGKEKLVDECGYGEKKESEKEPNK
jgi:hypothetical protein